MTVFRWIVGVIGAFLAIGGALSFGLFIAFDAQLWLQRGRTFRHLIWVLLLFWFNVEVWGKVILTIVRWNKG
jgi:hypothetical protein